MTFIQFVCTYWYVGLEILWVLWTLYKTCRLIYWANIESHDKVRWYWHIKRVKSHGSVYKSVGCLELLLFVFGWINIIVLIIKFII